MRELQGESFVLTGVGGQGVLVAANLLSRALLAAGLEVKQAEIHGMAQRGGSVLCFVRSGQQVNSPLVDPGTAGVVLALERLESVRHAHYLAPAGRLLSCSRLIPPVGQAADDLLPLIEAAERDLRSRGVRIVTVDSAREAKAAGNPRTANTVLVGALSALLQVDQGHWETALAEAVPAHTLEANLVAFRRGRTLAAASAGS